jgi:hypothetical protein
VALCEAGIDCLRGRGREIEIKREREGEGERERERERDGIPRVEERLSGYEMPNFGPVLYLVHT